MIRTKNGSPILGPGKMYVSKNIFKTKMFENILNMFLYILYLEILIDFIKLVFTILIFNGWRPNFIQNPIVVYFF